MQSRALLTQSDSQPHDGDLDTPTTTLRLAINDQVRAYLATVMSAFAARAPALTTMGDTRALSETVFRILTDRQFGHLSRAQVQGYREKTLRLIAEGLKRGGPLEFWYDVGPGYHASIRPGKLDLRFGVGFSELLILHQIASFCARLGYFYAPGARFWLVVDNLCALRTNDIGLQHTNAYCSQFRQLIRELGLETTVGIVAESEVFDIPTYDRMLAAVKVQLHSAPIDTEVDNVARFMGRRCTPVEAAHRIERYRRACIVTERLLAGIVRGVRMAQRASPSTLGFRAFPGGDSRTQCGEVGLTLNVSGRLHPLLLTSRNINAYHCTRYSTEGQLPASISHLLIARARAAVR
jgi:hypothetical protein